MNFNFNTTQTILKESLLAFILWHERLHERPNKMLVGNFNELFREFHHRLKFNFSGSIFKMNPKFIIIISFDFRQDITFETYPYHEIVEV